MNKESDIRVFNHHLIENPSNDMGALLEKTRNAQMYTFFEIFKGMMDAFPSPEECMTMLNSDRFVFFNKYIKPLTDKINRLKNDYRSNKVYDAEWFERMSKAGLAEPDLVDILDVSPEKLMNPTLSDIMPDICLSEQTFMETETNGNIQFPYGTIPMMCMIPSVSSIYDKHDDMSRLYYKVNRDRKCYPESPILEISIKSLLADYSEIYSEYNVETKTLSSAGLSTMKSIIEKYADFTLPLIFVTLRKDYEFTEDYINDIYTHFSANYQSAIVANKYMYGITNALVYSKLGHDLIHAFAFIHATSTIDLLNQNDPYRTLLTETISTASGCDCLQNYLRHIESQKVEFGALVEEGLNERDALASLMYRLFNMILSILSESISLDGNYQMNTKLGKVLMSALGPLKALSDDDVGSFSAIHRALAHVAKCCEHGTILDLTKTVAEVQSVRTVTTAPGVRSNRAQFTPIAQQILSGRELQQYNFIGNNSAALECANMVKEINRTKMSNAAMRMLATECQEIKTREDAKRITTEAEIFKEALKTSSSQVTNEDTETFRVFLNNVTNEVAKWEESELKNRI